MAKRIPFVVVLWLLTDVWFFTAVKVLTSNNLVLRACWGADALIGAVILLVALSGRLRSKAPALISWLMSLMLLSLIPKLCTLPVLLIGAILQLVLHSPAVDWWISALSASIAAVTFCGLLFGLTRGRHFYQVHTETLYFDDLPSAFDGFTITQLSDIHSGSFSSKNGVEKGINLVNEQRSDVILFTGDLVNNQAAEMDPWIASFARLDAPFGKFSVLGNHDYGDYIHWRTAEEKAANLERLKNVHKEIGFRLLMNESVVLTKDKQSIVLVGVENWGKGGFHKYGDLKKATVNVQENDFKILLSHDPSHWEEVTLDHHHHIHLTFAGHTHGMQFGIELFGFKWSPIKYIYKQWAGLYQRDGKYLYVNRGFGFLGLKGRVGIWPEITVITLKKQVS